MTERYYILRASAAKEVSIQNMLKLLAVLWGLLVVAEFSITQDLLDRLPEWMHEYFEEVKQNDTKR
jgi:hypothetical protein